MVRNRLTKVVLALAATSVVGCETISYDEYQRRMLGLASSRELLQRGQWREAGITFDYRGSLTEVRSSIIRLSRELSLWEDMVPVDSPARLALPPVLVLHGIPASSLEMLPILRDGHGSDGKSYEGLSKLFDVYVLDLLDAGLTYPPDTGHQTFDKQAEYVRQFIEQQIRRPVVLLGWSYGGEVAWRLAARYPHLVENLILICSSGYKRHPSEIGPIEKRLRNDCFAYEGHSIVTRAAVKQELSRLVVQESVITDRMVDRFLLYNTCKPVWETWVDLARDDTGRRQDLISAIRAPTLLVWGRGDPDFPLCHAAQFQKAISNSRREDVPGTGHFPHVENPKEVVEKIQDWLAGQLNNQSWSIVKHAIGERVGFEAALVKALAAVRLRPRNGAFLNTLGIAAYRNGQFKKAGEFLRQSDRLNGGNPADAAFLCMTYLQLGEQVKARSEFARLCDLMGDEDDTTDGENVAFLSEAGWLMSSRGLLDSNTITLPDKESE